jgi:hypothetical protein
MGRACSMNTEKMTAYRILVGKPDGKRSLGRQRRIWVESIKMGLKMLAVLKEDFRVLLYT